MITTYFDSREVQKSPGLSTYLENQWETFGKKSFFIERFFRNILLSRVHLIFFNSQHFKLNCL